MTEITLKVTATGKYLTLDELGKFVQDAHRSGLPGDTHIAAQLRGFSGKLKEVSSVEPNKRKIDSV